MQSHTATITSKYQIQIPAAIRKELNLKHGKVKVYTEKKKIVIEPKSPKKGIMALAGSMKVKNPVPADKIRDYIDYSDL
jgi:AbrB family looped-hinge helix DNA binding protein